MSRTPTANRCTPITPSHRLKILPGQLLALPRRERAFIYASIDLQIEKEKKEAAKAKRPEGQEGQVIKWPAYLHSFRSRTE